MTDKPIYDITPHTLIDYEGKIGAVVWFSGCPLRCVYCHNPHLIPSGGRYSADWVLAYMSKRREWNDGVVLSGGECCMFDGLEEFCKNLKDMGFAVKIDTSGVRPKTVLELAEKSLIDTVALDFKGLEGMFETVSGGNFFSLFDRTLKGLLSLGFDFSVRTTVHADYLREADIVRMGNYLYDAGYRGVYTVQKAVTSVKTLFGLDEPVCGFDVLSATSNAKTRFVGF